MQHTLPTYSAALLILFCLTTIPTQAETTDSTEKESDQQQLQSILQELDSTAKQRQQQNMRLETLSRQLECNWRLLSAYEACGQLQENNSDQHVSCLATAKQNAARCLEGK